MSLEVLLVPPRVELTYRDESLAVVLAEDGPFEERAIDVMPLLRRVYRWAAHQERPDAELYKTFLQARRLAYEPFLLRDPDDFLRTNVSLGDGDASKLTFDLPGTLNVEAYRGFPIAATVLAYGALVGGAPRAVTSVNVDARQVTLAGPAPGLGVAVVLPRYEEYRLCRFAPAVDWMHGDVSWFESEVEIREVFRAL